MILVGHTYVLGPAPSCLATGHISRAHVGQPVTVIGRCTTYSIRGRALWNVEGDSFKKDHDHIWVDESQLLDTFTPFHASLYSYIRRELSS